MLMMASHILKFADFTKTQKFRYLENEILFFLQIKKFINYSSRATLWQRLVFQHSLDVFRAWCFPIWHFCHYFHHFGLSFVIALSSWLLSSSKSFLAPINHLAFLSCSLLLAHIQSKMLALQQQRSRSSSVINKSRSGNKITDLFLF